MPRLERSGGASTTRRGNTVSEHNRRTWGERQPISRHPLFPAIVALWCGALFGVASIVVSPALIEGVVVTLGIDKVIPMAAPPLGATTRILLALLMTGIGAAVGLLLGRRFAAAAPAQPQERRVRAVPVEQERRKSRIVLARKDRVLSPRRRSFISDATDSTHEAERAPVPGRESPILSVTEFDLDGFEDADASLGQAADDSAASVAEPEDRARTSASFAPRPPAGAQVFLSAPDRSEAAQGDAAAAPGSLFETYSREISARAGQAAPREATILQPPVPGFMLLSSANAAGGEMSQAAAPDQPAEETAPPDATLVDEAFDQADPVDAWESEEPAAAESELTAWDAPASEALPNPAGPTAADRIASAELDELSPVELLERLALAMAQRREHARLAALAAVDPEALRDAEDEPLAESTSHPEVEVEATPPLAFAPLSFDAPRFDPVPLRSVETGRSEAQSEPEPAARPVPRALRPVDLQAFAEEDEDDELPAYYIPPRHIGLTPAGSEEAGFKGVVSAAEDEGDDEEESRVLDEGYSSLLDLSRPMPRLASEEEAEAPAPAPAQASESAPFARPGPASVASGDEPAAMGERRFDAPARPDPEETERALRAALATLQRMSGAA